MTKDKINELLKKFADSYKPQISDDPEENECLACTMSEKSHKVFPAITCGNFQDGRKKG